jgi:hypothetical protein
MQKQQLLFPVCFYPHPDSYKDNNYLREMDLFGCVLTVYWLKIEYSQDKQENEVEWNLTKRQVSFCKCVLNFCISGLTYY